MAKKQPFEIDHDFINAWRDLNLGKNFECIDTFFEGELLIVIYQDTNNPIWGDMYRVPFNKDYEIVFPK